MRTIKRIRFSILISLLISSAVLVFHVVIENNSIKQKTNRHFFDTSCIISGYFATNIIGAEGISDIVKLKIINHRTFKVERLYISFKNKRSPYGQSPKLNWEESDLLQQKIYLENQVLESFTEGCKFDNSESKFVFAKANIPGQVLTDVEWSNNFNKIFKIKEDSNYEGLVEQKRIESNDLLATVSREDYFTHYELNYNKALLYLSIIMGALTIIIFGILHLFIKK